MSRSPGVEPAQLSHPEATAVEQLEHRVVAEADGLVVAVDRGGRLVEEHLELVTAQHARQPGLALGRVQARRRIGLDAAGAREPREVPT